MPIWDQLQDKAEELLKKGSSQNHPVQGPSGRPKTPDHPPNSATPEPPEVPPPSATIAGAVSAQDDKWDFNRLKSALEGGDANEKRMEEAHRQMRGVAAGDEKKGGLFGKITDILDGDDEERLRLELVKIESEEKTLNDLERQIEQGRDLGDKLKEKLTGPDPEYVKQKERISVERAQIRLRKEAIEKKLAEERANPEWHEQFVNKLGGRQDELEDIRRKEAALQAEKKHDNIFEKFKDKVDGESEQERQLRLEKERLEAEQRGTVGWQVKDFLGKNEPATSSGGGFSLKNKLNEAAGGGAKGEANEDQLDKAIDMFQQHVLKQGDQHNESAIEQKKDEAIAAGIKSALSAVTGKP
ncbi:hypothetical protein FRC02_003694 [Tulasnella sp. 418]|nr:hypothetical protein FRC02_003694 [Tulasnella sp. 418]